MKLIIHAPSKGSLRRARANARNLLKLHPKAEVKIVANAAGLVAALDEPDPETDSVLVLCEHTLKTRHMDKPKGYKTAKAAVALIAELQAQGWAYMRA